MPLVAQQASLSAKVFGFNTITVENTPTVIFLTTGTTWQVPNNWNSNIIGVGGYANKIECLSGGAGGGGGDQGGSGGGGGAYSSIENLQLIPGTSVSYVIGAGGSGGASDPDNSSNNGGPGGNTWFGSTTTVFAQRGTCPTGGQLSAGVGTIKFSGGNGQPATSEDRGFGAGGAAGKTSNGFNGSGGTGGQPGTGGGWVSSPGGASAAPGKGGNQNQVGSLYGGGGGGGADDTAGRRGANGIIVISYFGIKGKV